MTTSDRLAELLVLPKTKLAELATELDVDGRSKLGHADLADAVLKAEAAQAVNAAAADERERVTAALEAAPPTSAELELEPGTPDEVGRQDLITVAQERAASRKPARVIGAPSPDSLEVS